MNATSTMHPVLARMALTVHDQLPDARRHELVPLIGRLFDTGESGTPQERHVLSVRLAAWCARQVLPLARPEDRGACEAAIEAAEGWCEGRVSATYAASAASVAYAAYRDARAEAAYAASVGGDAALAAVAAATAIPEAASPAAGAVAAVAAVDAAGGGVVALLIGILDEYDRLTGRTAHREVGTEDDLAALVAALTER